MRDYNESPLKEQERRFKRRANYNAELQAQIMSERERSLRATVESMSAQEKHSNAKIRSFIYD